MQSRVRSVCFRPRRAFPVSTEICCTCRNDEFGCVMQPHCLYSILICCCMHSFLCWGGHAQERCVMFPRSIGEGNRCKITINIFVQ